MVDQQQPPKQKAPVDTVDKKRNEIKEKKNVKRRVKTVTVTGKSTTQKKRPAKAQKNGYKEKAQTKSWAALSKGKKAEEKLKKFLRERRRPGFRPK